ncbi:unnamed protein product, partial [Laminaria digitata]
EHLREVDALTRVASDIFRGQTVLSWGALMSARRRDTGPTNGAAGLLLNASRSLFPLSAGSFARLLSSLVHSQDTADIAHAILAGIDEDEDEDENSDGYIIGGGANGAGSAQPGETNRYVAIL